ncbi:MAG TPA: sigma-70 family RNA polymerase sigma factor [Kofleriaceae bacterium]|jgi:RNA polymerase sigma-70 factor (ECF subfamily)
MPDDDLALLDRWRGGDTAAGNELFQRHFDALYRFFQHKTDGDIDDLVQETFLGCVNGVEAFGRRSTFRTYLFGIARNILFAYWRRRASRGQAIDFDEVSVASLSTSVGTRLARAEARAALLEAMQSLPLEQQTLLELFYWQEFDRRSLAEILDVEEATIGTRLFRARKELQAALATRKDSDADFERWLTSQRS